MRPRLPASRRQQNQQQHLKNHLKQIQQQQQQHQASQNDAQLSSKFQTPLNLSMLPNYHFIPTSDGGYWKPIPLIKQDGPLQFEVFMFFYLSVAMMLQYLHLYRSVWWLPHSYNSYALNFYLIDTNLFIFSELFLARRLIWTLFKKLIFLIVPPNWRESFDVVFRSLTTFFVLMSLLVFVPLIMEQHPIYNIGFLSYPCLLYLVLYGFSGDPFLEIVPPTPNGKIKFGQDASGIYRTTTHHLLHQHISKGDGNGFQPELVRQEVSVLRSDFNDRMKHILYNSSTGAYFATFVPCWFAPAALHFDLAWVVRHGVLVWVGAFVLSTIHVFPSAYTHMLHRTALSLGYWTKIEGRISPTFYNQWSGSTVWPIGSIVRHGKELYKAEADTTTAEPGNSFQAKFYSLFYDPTTSIMFLLMVQSGLVLAQHLSLTWSTQWYQILSESLMLFANYYALFQLVRDYLVYWKLFDTFDRCQQVSCKIE